MTADLIVCRDATGAHWGLGSASPDRPLVLIGWRVRPEPVDAGMPAAVADILSRAMCATGWAGFPASTRSDLGGLAPPGDDDTRIASVPGSGGRWRRLLGDGTDFARQVSTRRPDHARTLFDDPGHPWWLGAQAASLSDPDRPPPTLDAATWRALLGPGWRSVVPALSVLGPVLGVLRAGVDGDVLGLCGAAPAFEDAFLGRVRGEAHAAGASYREVAHAEFA